AGLFPRFRSRASRACLTPRPDHPACAKRVPAWSLLLSPLSVSGSRPPPPLQVRSPNHYGSCMVAVSPQAKEALDLARRGDTAGAIEAARKAISSQPEDY